MKIAHLFLYEPCANCPFLKVGAIELHPGRLDGIIEDLTTTGVPLYEKSKMRGFDNTIDPEGK